jgi:serine/threonine protein kinase/tetratricopeptide (TPR) repeat protein
LPPGDTFCAACARTAAPDEVTSDPNAARTRTLGAETAGGPPFTGPKRVAGYRVLREIGSGGMGTVFEARDEQMHRRVALKVLSRHHAPSEKAATRFAHEAWIAGKLDHPNLVKVYDRGSWEELDYYSMELVDGGSLADVIGNMKRWGRDEKVGLEFGSREYIHWAITQVIAAARGLDHAHRHGVVHRDVKPMNLLYSRELETVKVADFGLALEDDTTRLTTAGKILGTLSYMAPEQLLGKGTFDARTDVYALGVTLFELLTLELPYPGKTQQLYMSAVLTTDARRPSKLNDRVSRDLETVTRKALEKDPADRYPSAGRLADDLENVLHLRPIEAQPPSRPKRVWKWARRKPIHAALLALLVLGAPTVSVLGYRAFQHRALVRQTRIDELWSDIRWALRAGNDVRAVELAARILDLDPRHPGALRCRVIGNVALSRSADDAATAKRFADVALEDSSNLTEALPGLSWPLRIRAWALRELGRDEQADEVEARARRLRAGAPSVQDLHFDGLLALDTGDYERAVELFTEVVARQPNSPAAISYRATAYEKLGRTDRAIDDYRIAAALAPGELFNYLRLGDLRTKQGALDEGAAYFGRMLEIEPATEQAFTALADVWLRKGRRALSEGDGAAALAHFERAEADARRGLAIDDGAAMAHLNLGASLMEQNRLGHSPAAERVAEAMGHYEEALRIWESPGRQQEGHRTLALLNLCDGWIQLGRLERALRVCSDAVEAEPGDPVNHYNLAGVLALLGRSDAAFAALEEDVRLGDRDWRYLSGDPWFESLRGDPRFSALIERMRRLPPDESGS